MMIKRQKLMCVLALLPCLLLGHAVNAKLSGPEKMDSLLKVLPKQQNDTNKVKVYNDLAYWCTSSADGISYASQALVLAGELGWEKGKAMSYTRLGNNYYSRSDYGNSLNNYLKALNIFDQVKDKAGTALLETDIALVYKAQNDLAKALEFSMLSMYGYLAMSSENRAANVMANICFIYIDMRRYDKALEYGMLSLKIREKTGDRNEVAESQQGVGQAYSLSGQYAKAFHYQFAALRNYQQVGFEKGIANECTDIASTYLAIAGDTVYKVAPDSFIAATRTQNLDSVFPYINKAIAIDQKDQHFNFLQRDHWIVAQAQRLRGDYKAALAAMDRSLQYRDSVFSEKNAEAITHFETQVAEEQKNKQIQLAELKVAKKRNETILLIVVVIVLVVVVLLIARERKKSEKLLLNILPAEVAAELKANGRSVARHFDHVTVLFTDFVDFTTIAERMRPQQLIDELDTCFKAFDEIMHKYGIEKIKTIGDAYMAAAGVPVADDDHALHVVQAAREIREFIRQRKAQYGDSTFDVRIGAHSGSVVAGIVGSKKFAYDIWGDTVNTAARMEQSSEAGMINISQTTMELIKDKFECLDRGEKAAKNKGYMKMYFVS